MTDDLWIVVPNWDRFQHYKDRHPPWIRVYAQLLHDPDYLGLSMASKGLLTMIWLAYSSKNGQLSVKDLSKVARRSISFSQLTWLSHAGFIDFSASKPLALLTETETESESPKSPYRKKPDRRVQAAETWIRNGVADEVPLERLSAVLVDEFKLNDAELVDRLVAQAKGRRQ